MSTNNVLTRRNILRGLAMVGAGGLVSTKAVSADNGLLDVDWATNHAYDFDAIAVDVVAKRVIGILPENTVNFDLETGEELNLESNPLDSGGNITAHARNGLVTFAESASPSGHWRLKDSNTLGSIAGNSFFRLIREVDIQKVALENQTYFALSRGSGSNELLVRKLNNNFQIECNTSTDVVHSTGRELSVGQERGIFTSFDGTWSRLFSLSDCSTLNNTSSLDGQEGLAISQDGDLVLRGNGLYEAGDVKDNALFTLPDGVTSRTGGAVDSDLNLVVWNTDEGLKMFEYNLEDETFSLLTSFDNFTGDKDLWDYEDGIVVYDEDGILYANQGIHIPPSLEEIMIASLKDKIIATFNNGQYLSILTSVVIGGVIAAMTKTKSIGVIIAILALVGAYFGGFISTGLLVLAVLFGLFVAILMFEKHNSTVTVE